MHKAQDPKSCASTNPPRSHGLRYLLYKVGTFWSMGDEEKTFGAGKNVLFDIELFEYCDIILYREM